jgi:hypothetical protein
MEHRKIICFTVQILKTSLETVKNNKISFHVFLIVNLFDNFWEAGQEFVL